MMCLGLLSAVVFGFCVKQFAEPDLWWHLRNAQNLVEHHSFSRADTYSFTAAGLPWLNFEWLSEVPYYLAFKMWSLQGVLLVSILLAVLIFAGVYYLCCLYGADCKDAVLATLLAIFLGVISIGPRVLLFGWLCMVALLLLLERFRRTGKGLWLLPIVFALWVNLHPSWIFGIVVLLLVIACGLFEGQWGLIVATRWTRSQLRNLLLALAASLAALFVNPFGYKLVLYPFDFLFRQPANMQFVEEWQSVNFSTGNGKLALFLVFALLLAVLFSRRHWRLQDVLLTAFALWVGLSHVRLLFFAGLVIPPILAPHLKLFPPYDPDLDKPWLNAAIMAAIAASLIFLFPSTTKLQQQIDDSYPTAALRFMQQQNMHGRLFNQYVWGGYIEWQAPELKPFIDGRADIFVYNGVFDDYFRAALMRQPLEILDKYHIDYALLEPGRPLAYLLEHSPSWALVHQDKVAILFERIGTNK